jgi:hypothetical protein
LITFTDDVCTGTPSPATPKKRKGATASDSDEDTPSKKKKAMPKAARKATPKVPAARKKGATLVEEDESDYVELEGEMQPVEIKEQLSWDTDFV